VQIVSLLRGQSENEGMNQSYGTVKALLTNKAPRVCAGQSRGACGSPYAALCVASSLARYLGSGSKFDAANRTARVTADRQALNLRVTGVSCTMADNNAPDRELGFRHPATPGTPDSARAKPYRSIKRHLRIRNMPRRCSARRFSSIADHEPDDGCLEQR
jgi:hypothetical protein